MWVSVMKNDTENWHWPEPAALRCLLSFIFCLWALLFYAADGSLLCLSLRLFPCLAVSASSIISFNIVHFSCVIVRRCQMTTPPPPLPSVHFPFSIFHFNRIVVILLGFFFLFVSYCSWRRQISLQAMRNNLAEGRVGIGYIQIYI